MKAKSRKQTRRNRHTRARRFVSGTPERPRMCISITNNNGSVQFIDDEAGVTLAGTSTAGNAEVRFNMSAAYELGKAGAEQAKGKGIEEVIVDRGGRKFHGRVREVVRGALDSGLKAGSSSLAAAGEPVQGDKEEQ